MKKKTLVINCSNCYSILYTIYRKTIKGKPNIKGKTNRKGSCQSGFFVLKTDYIHLKTSQMADRVCISKQLKWNKFPYYGDRLSGKIFSRGLTSPDSLSEEIAQVE